MTGQSSVYFSGFDEINTPNFEAGFGGDTLDALMKGQLELMELMRYKNFEPDLYFFLTKDNLQKEASEATEFFGDITKPWKASFDVDLDAVKEEWVDVLFFWLQGAIALGMTPEEIFFTYFRKHSKNKERIKAKLNADNSQL